MTGFESYHRRFRAIPIRRRPRGRRWCRGLAMLGVIGLALGGAACNDVVENPIKPVVVTSPIVRSINIISGQVDTLTVQLQAFAQFTDDTVQEVTNQAMWGSSNSAVATVTPTGLVTAIGNGSATITATFDGVTGSFPVNAAGL